MTRRYDSSRRKKAAHQTREKILRAALKLHWQGITAYEPLAAEAGCSLPTLRKHFPTKEELFRGCTRTHAASLTLPDLDALRAIGDPSRRLEESVRELCRLHEAMFGYAWLGARLREESPTLAREMNAYHGLTDAITAIVTVDDPGRTAVTRGLLDFLTYRALRNSGALAPPDACDAILALLRPLFGVETPSGPPSSKRESRTP